MKKFISTLAILVASWHAYAQKSDSVFMGANYANEIYYKLSGGQVKSEPVKNWDLSFSAVGSFDERFFAIRANYSNGVRVYEYPKFGTSDWSSFDTTGWNGWTQQYNTDSSWWFGAFNREPYSHPSYSWGAYTNSGVISGNRLYLIGFTPDAFSPPNTFKKLWIEERKSSSGVRTWKFKYADVDGSNETSVTINDADYPAKNFAYYSLRDGKALDREPANSQNSWDIVFTRYWADLQNPTFPYYQVTGVLTNVNSEVIKATGLPVKDMVKPAITDTRFSNHMNVIGYNWKNSGPGGTTIEDSTAYFIKVDSTVAGTVVNTKIYKLWFTDFGGSANGKTVFNTELVTEVKNTTSIHGVEAKPTLSVYPNPAQEAITITTANIDAKPIAVKIHDISGKLVYSTPINSNTNWGVYTLDVSAFAKGVYVVSLVTDKEALFQRVVKQ